MILTVGDTGEVKIVRIEGELNTLTSPDAEAQLTQLIDAGARKIVVNFERLDYMDRQTLRDAVVRYNAKGLEGLHDRPKGYSPRRLTADEEAALAAVIIAGPEPERDGVCAWTRADLCRWLEERFAKTYHPSSMTRVLRRMGFSRQKARPSHPRRDAEAQERFKKGGFATS